jgi:hypothetical protein
MARRCSGHDLDFASREDVVKGKRKPRSPEQQWCDGVMDLATKLQGSPKQIAEALLATVFFRMAEARGLMDTAVPFEKRYALLAERGGDPSMLSALTPSFTEIPVDAEGTYHVELLGHLHGLLMSTEERRGRGSHYTPREMAAEIVMHTLDPLVLPADENEPPHRHGGRPDKPTAEEIARLRVCDSEMGGGVFLIEAIRYLGDALHKACEREGKNMSLRDCRTLVALRCVYGVDKDPTACWLAQCVVWLFLEDPTLSRYAFVHNLRYGDALVGLDDQQLCSFHWERGHAPIPEIVEYVTPRLHAAVDARMVFRSHRLTDEEAIKLGNELDKAMAGVQFLGNLCLAAFFTKDKPKAREVERKRILALVLQWLRSSEAPCAELVQIHEHLTEKLWPFHWQWEFPEALLWHGKPSPVQPHPEALVTAAPETEPKVVVVSKQHACEQLGLAL